MVKKPPAMQETLEVRVQSLGREDPLEEGMAAHSNILAWRIPWTEEPGRLQSMGLQPHHDFEGHISCITCTAGRLFTTESRVKPVTFLVFQMCPPLSSNNIQVP